MKFLKSKKFWKRFVILLFIVPIFLFLLLIGIVFWKQDAIVQELIGNLNKDFKGHFELRDSHISPFENFPYISIDLENLIVYVDENDKENPVINIKDVYIGFDIWTLISGKFDIKTIKLKNGFINLIQHTDGTLNLTNAFEPIEKVESTGEEFHLDLQSIEIENVDINKLNEENNVHIDILITKALSKFKTSPNHIMISLDSQMELTVVDNGDTTFIKHKHFDVNTKLDYIEDEQKLVITPSEVLLEGSNFKAEGSIDFDDDLNMNITFEGEKPNFDMFMAFAPEELAPTLKKYDNKGKVYFKSSVKGKSINGHTPRLDAEFGCSEAFFTNSINKKKVDDLQFKGYFTNGDEGTLESMEFSLKDFSASPEAGKFSGDLTVKNFKAPEIDLKLISEFQLDFLANFFNLTDLKNLTGGIKLTMNFRDIIDLENPENSIEKLNESYYTELEIKDLSFKMPGYHLPLKDLDLKAVMDGHEAKIEYCNIKIGNSDINLKGNISDLPAILHHSGIDVLTHLEISSKYLDLYQLTDNKQEGNIPVDEQISDFSMGLTFKSSAKALTESPNLPIGEFFIDNLYAKMKHYPHTLHDFHADLFIEEKDFRIIDFKGMIDNSDFHFAGKLGNYDLWFMEDPKGDTKIEFALDSKLLQMEDLFSYGGENYVPEDYRHEEIKGLKVHGFADIHFIKGLKSADIYLDQFTGLMKIHPTKFDNFNGRVHIEDEHITLEKFGGKIGKSSFVTDMVYYYGESKELKMKDNYIKFKSSHLDFDQLFNYNPPPTSKNAPPVNHDSVFNIYELPFPEMTIDMDIKHLKYHKYLIQDFDARIITHENHFIDIDTLSMKLAGGKINMSGYFDGSNSKLIYLNPKVRFSNLDIDQLMFKFDNFGQDYLVSDNLHGELSGYLYGKIHMHTDMVPKIDDSEIHVDIDVTRGRLENYGPMELLSDYFKDKNLTKIIFDTLSNHIDMTNGLMTIPKMTINSSLGFIEISGKQDMDMNMEYFVRVPLKMVTQAGASKLFGKKKEEVDPEQEDEIIKQDANKKIKYVNIKITGDAEDYKIALGKDKGEK